MTTDVETMGSPHVSKSDGTESIENAFLKTLVDEETLSKKGDEEDLEAPSEEEEEVETKDEETPSEDDTNSDDEDTVDSDSNDDTDDKPSKKRVDDDDAVTTVKVGDEETEVSLRDLKRAYGKDKALTQKEQLASETKRKADERLVQYETSLKHHREMALKAYEPYVGANFTTMAMSGVYTKEEIEAAMEAERDARANLEYFDSELQFASQQTAQEQQRREHEEKQSLQAARVDCVTALKSKGWNQEIHSEVAGFFTDNGAKRSMVEALDGVTDPEYWEILRDAMRFRKGNKALETKTVKTVKQAPKVIKSASEPVAKSKPDAVAKAMERLKRDGSSENVKDAFLARLTGGE